MGLRPHVEIISRPKKFNIHGSMSVCMFLGDPSDSLSVNSQERDGLSKRLHMPSHVPLRVARSVHVNATLTHTNQNVSKHNELYSL